MFPYKREKLIIMIKLKKEDFIKLPSNLSYKSDLEEIFEEMSVLDLDSDDSDDDENDIVIFQRVDFKSPGAIIYGHHKGYGREFLIKFSDESLFHANVYEFNNMYEDGNRITLCGWDYNLIVNTDTKEVKKINVR